MQEALGLGYGTRRAGETLSPQPSGSRRGVWAPRGPGAGKQGAAGEDRARGVRGRRPVVQAPRTAAHPRRPPREPVRPRETEAGHSTPSAASPIPEGRPGSPGRPPASGGGEARVPAPPAQPPPPGCPAGPPLTTETWRPGPGRRSGARGSQLWAPQPGDGGRGRGRGGRGRRPGRAPAEAFLFPAAGGGAGRGRGGPGALTPSAPPALQPLGRGPAFRPAARRKLPISQRRSPRLRARGAARSHPATGVPPCEWPNRDFGADEGPPAPGEEEGREKANPGRRGRAEAGLPGSGPRPRRPLPRQRLPRLRGPSPGLGDLPSPPRKSRPTCLDPTPSLCVHQQLLLTKPFVSTASVNLLVCVPALATGREWAAGRPSPQSSSGVLGPAGSGVTVVPHPGDFQKPLTD